MVAAILCALFAADAEPAPAAAKVIASAGWNYQKVDTEAGGKDGKQFVIRDAAQLVAAIPAYAALDAQPAVVERMATAALAKALKVKDIDWKKQMLVVTTAGSRGSGGFRVEVTGLKVKGDTMTVSWKATPPKGAATAAFTHPGVVALVPAHKKVEFDPPAKK